MSSAPFAHGPFAGVPRGEYALPGALRDQLVAAILDGTKTSTSSLREEYVRDGEELPRVGDLEVVVDSDDDPVCVTRTTGITLLRLADVTDDHARAEGEGYVDAADWRAGHEEFWSSAEYVESLGDPPLVIDDDTEVVCTRFEVVERL
jgi:uncharacterized protein YhfF